MRERIEPVFAALVFPVVLGGSLLGASHQISGGADPAAVIGPFIFGCMGFLAVMERIFPFERSWLHSSGDLKVDVGYFFVNTVAIRLCEGLLALASMAAAVWIAENISPGLWPSSWAWPFQLALGLVLGEAIEYSWHRALHEVPGLWRLHAQHHSAPRLYFLNAVRFHPIDIVVGGLGRLLPAAALGAGPDVIALMTLVGAVHGYFQHANLQLKLGPLNWVFSMAELHRWHHSRVLEEANSNYGGNLILYDILFGTRFLPANRRPPADVGIAGMPNFPMDILSQLASPFRWKRVEAQSR